MTYAKVQGSTLLAYPYGMPQLQVDNPTTNYGGLTDPGEVFAETTPAIENGWSLVVVQTSAQPSFNPMTQTCTEGSPTLKNGIWTQTWLVSSLPTNQVVANQAGAALAAGLTITCTSTPALSGTYACDDATTTKLAKIELAIERNGVFPGSNGTQFAWPDSSGSFHVFPSVTLFTAFSTALANYVADVDLFAAGAPGAALPASTVTIP